MSTIIYVPTLLFLEILVIQRAFSMSYVVVDLADRFFFKAWYVIPLPSSYKLSSNKSNKDIY